MMGNIISLFPKLQPTTGVSKYIFTLFPENQGIENALPNHQPRYGTDLG